MAHEERIATARRIVEEVMARFGRARRASGYTRCRVAYIVDGRGGYAPWRPIADYPTLVEGVGAIMARCPNVKAFVERR